MPKASRQPSNKNYRLTIAYDGTVYGGWQLQPEAVTVQDLVEKALAKIAGEQVVIYGSGRTDAGVHARAQVAHCAFTTRLTLDILRRALNANLPFDIRVLRVQLAPAKFHARFSAKGKEYRYQIDCSEIADPFTRFYAWHHPWLLEVGPMRQAAKLIVGKHDFSALSANPMREVESHVRQVKKLTINRRGNLVTIAITADGFLYKMARSIVGALVKVGAGRMTRHELHEFMNTKKRTALVATAPAHGLFLWRVFY